MPKCLKLILYHNTQLSTFVIRNTPHEKAQLKDNVKSYGTFSRKFDFMVNVEILIYDIASTVLLPISFLSCSGREPF